MNSPRAGWLLVATPVLTAGTFERTVVLLVAHGAEGAVGVVLNRASETPLHRVLPGWADLATEPPSVFDGGPVAPEAAICLARLRRGSATGWAPIDGGTLGTVDLDTPPETLAPDVTGLRVYAGYAGWAPGQLEAEIADGAWLVVPTNPDDPFSRRPATLWPVVLRRQPGLVAAMAHYPPDVTLN